MPDYTGRVAAVVIPRSDDEKEFLIAKRSDNGEWEFPGGKEDLKKIKAYWILLKERFKKN